jgi:hypothetical protein
MGDNKEQRYLTCFICLVAMLLVVACTSTGTPPKPVPPTALEPPVYPNAINVQAREVDSGEAVPAQDITFETSDSPQQVMSFYKDILGRDGWEFNSELSTSDFLYFRWVDYSAYSLVVTIKPGEAGALRVELYLLTILAEE